MATKKTDTLENAVIKGNLTVIQNADPNDYGPGDIECIGTVFTDTILENTGGLGVSLEDVLFKDGNVSILVSTTPSTSTTTGALTLSGGIGISNITDAVSEDNGGALTIAGGVAIKKKVYIGGSVSLTDTTATTSRTTGALTVSGGVGISGEIQSGSITVNNGVLQILSSSPSILVPSNSFLRVGASNQYQTQFLVVGDSFGSDPGRMNFRYLNYLAFESVNGVSSRTERVRFLSNGRVGINTSNPNSILSVNGTVDISGISNITNTTATTSNTLGALLLSGGIGISNTTDALSSINGGSITTAGGVAIAKKLFVGTDLSIGGTSLFNNYIQTFNITSPSNPPINNTRFYTDTSDSLLKSKNSSGVVTTYQPANTKGDLISHNGTTQTRLPVGGNSSVLLADSTEPTGIKWSSLDLVSRTLNFAVSNKPVIYTEYTHVSSIIYEGSNNTGVFSEFRISSFKNSSSSYTYSVRVWDSINKQVICEIIGLNNQDYAVNSTTVINNLPTTKTILECHCKLSTDNGFGIIVNSVGLVY